MLIPGNGRGIFDIEKTSKNHLKKTKNMTSLIFGGSKAIKWRFKKKLLIRKSMVAGYAGGAFLPLFVHAFAQKAKKLKKEKRSGKYFL